MSNEKSTRITKSMKFDALRAYLNGEDLPHGLTKDDLLAFIDSEQALLVKKNSGDKKPTATQLRNDADRAVVLEYLALNPKSTCTAILQGVPEFTKYSNQYIASLLRQSLKDGTVRKDVVKGRSVFSLAD